MLKEYKAKRDFKKTSEPAGSSKKHASKQPMFVVQKHQARALHYDVRLEIDGVLKSWAVPKGPPLKSADKRLAVMTEDHPMEYASFEGEIPEGEYGAGTVEIWDKGTYHNIKQKKDGFEMPMKSCVREGRIEISFSGKKLKGAYALIRTSFGGQKKNWLMLKMKA
ncbi:MAG: DNA polymerase ligase N-terminal domain-containing protein [Patescibacteria group bacterium]|nr:DNA polymerase ligase N-terminal domain-containing protein [Patescibacteria group bacterium]